MHAYGDLNQDEATAFDAHLAGCPACQQEFAAFREIIKLTRSIREPLSPPHALDRTILAAAANHARKKSFKDFTRFMRFFAMPIPATAIAILFVAAFTMLYTLEYGSIPTKPMEESVQTKSVDGWDASEGAALMGDEQPAAPQVLEETSAQPEILAEPAPSMSELKGKQDHKKDTTRRLNESETQKTSPQLAKQAPVPAADQPIQSGSSRMSTSEDRIVSSENAKSVAQTDDQKREKQRSEPMTAPDFAMSDQDTLSVQGAISDKEESAMVSGSTPPSSPSSSPTPTPTPSPTPTPTSTSTSDFTVTPAITANGVSPG